MSDINVGAISEALNDKMDRDLQNVDTVSGADAVIEYQLPTVENGYKWYRKYASGWVEQGGTEWVENNTITLSVVMANTEYFLSTGGFVIANVGRQSITKYTDRFVAGSAAQVCGMAGWLVMGMAA